MGASLDPDSGRWWVDLFTVLQPGIAVLLPAGGIWGYLKIRRDQDAKARGDQTNADAAERVRLDKADADQLKRHTDEIARKDAEIVAHRTQCAAEIAALRAEKDAEIRAARAEHEVTKIDRDDGWRGLVRAADGWRECRHDANEIIGRLCLKLEATGIAFEDPKRLPAVPDLDTLAGRKGREPK